MSVSVYYSAGRAEPLTGSEISAVERVVTTRAASFPYDDEENLYLYDADGDDRGDEVLAGSTKLPTDPDRWIPVIAHVLGSVTELRRIVADAEWHVHVDDVDVPWDESEGYVLPGLPGA
ncbi:hypothetical protein [Streptomyces sp. NPDC014734]|uniref:hypothetical protein n=1 Tax=Streptomyces sp. NPDC014734 TaxID=3364886 RepID=UPI0036FA208D